MERARSLECGWLVGHERVTAYLRAHHDQKRNGEQEDVQKERERNQMSIRWPRLTALVLLLVSCIRAKNGEQTRAWLRRK